MVIDTLISQLHEQLDILKEERPVIEELAAAIAAAAAHFAKIRVRREKCGSENIP